jgi:outer membrane lipoprotein-sorting protein
MNFKIITRPFLALILMFTSLIMANAQPTTAKDIVKKAYDKMQGKTGESTMNMTIVRPEWQRTITFKSWSKGSEYSIALITAPAKEKGQTFLKRNNEIWNWVPSINRMIKLPASMMSQGWMGSDYSNDDLLKESSIVNDYDHTLLGEEIVSGLICYKVKLVPKPDAAVVWGYIVKWISKDNFLQLKSEYYDEDQVLVKTETGSNIKLMGDREIPTHFEIIPADKPKNKTIVEISNAKFDIPINDSFFSQQNMKMVK